MSMAAGGVPERFSAALAGSYSAVLAPQFPVSSQARARLYGDRSLEDTIVVYVSAFLRPTDSVYGDWLFDALDVKHLALRRL
jgi:hypothetical protein